MGAIFLAAFLVVCAGSLGAALHRFFAVDPLDAALVSIAVVAVFGLFQVLIARVRDRAQFGDRVAEFSRGAADLARQVAEAGRRLAAAETEIARSAERTRAALEPTSAEIELLRRSAKELAQSVAAHETALRGRNGGAADPGPLAAVALALDAIAEPAPAFMAAPGGNGDAAPACENAAQDMAGTILQAAEAGRFELYLAPIVTLPQRKVRYYEATARLRTESGELLNPCDYARQARCASSIAVIDDVLLFRCVQVVRRLLAKNREVGVFCHLAGRALLEPAFLGEVSDFIEANRALAGFLVFEFAQKQVRAMGTTERECLAELAGLGFRFAMHRLGDLVVEPRELAERGFRFVKIPAALLLNRGEAKASGVEAAELSDRLGRFGIDLIAEDIESEVHVVDLLDHDVRFGQGPLFSLPRPVRAEIVQGSADAPLPRASGRPAAAAIVPAGRVEPAPLAEPLAAESAPVGLGLSA